MAGEIEDLLSTIYHALRTARRRFTIQYLSDSDKRNFTTRELARAIASHEQQVPIHQATGEPYRNAYNALSQTHLPTLSEAGIIIYDSDRQVIRTGPRFQFAVLVLSISRTTYQTLID